MEALVTTTKYLLISILIIPYTAIIYMARFGYPYGILVTLQQCWSVNDLSFTTIGTFLLNNLVFYSSGLDDLSTW